MKRYADLIEIRAENLVYKPFHLSHNVRFLYVLKGSISCRFVAGVHTMREGDIEIINIDEPVGFESTGEENLVLTFEISAGKAKSYCDLIDKGLYNCSTTLFYPSQAETEDQRRLKAKARKLYSYYINEKDDIYLENLISEMIRLICEKCHDLQNMFREEKSSDVRAKRFVRIYTYIYENHNKKINLKELAESEYVSQQYLSKEFNDRLNMNFKDTLEYYRVINSVRYLITTRKSITMISELCGFSASRYFYKHFSLYLKCTPMEFRRKYLSCPEKIYEFAVDDAAVQTLVLKMKENDDEEFSISSDYQDFTDFRSAQDTVSAPVVYSKRKISRELLQSFANEAGAQLPPVLSVAEIKLQSVRERLHKLIYGKDSTGTPPAAFIFFLNGSVESVGKRELILCTEQTVMAAYQLGHRAETEGMHFNLSYDILDYCDEIRQATELSAEVTPLILVELGYPA